MNKPLRCLFLGTPDFAAYHLEALLLDQRVSVVGVMSQPDRPSGRSMKKIPSEVKVLALKSSLPILTPESLKDPGVYEWIQSCEANCVVVVAYGQILPRQFLNLFPEKVVNIHGSLLPRWRGAAPIQRALMEGDNETGVCLQVMVPALDAGPIIGQRILKLNDTIEALELHDLMKVKGAELLAQEWIQYLKGEIIPHPQDQKFITYASKILKEESFLDWTRTANQLHNQVRGMTLGPGCSFVHKGKRIKIHRTQVVPFDDQNKKDDNKENQKETRVPGLVLTSSSKQGLHVQCGQGVLEILELQLEGKKKQLSSEFLLGYPFFIPGDFLGDS